MKNTSVSFNLRPIAVGVIAAFGGQLLLPVSRYLPFTFKLNGKSK